MNWTARLLENIVFEIYDEAGDRMSRLMRAALYLGRRSKRAAK